MCIPYFLAEVLIHFGIGSDYDKSLISLSFAIELGQKDVLISKK